MLTLRHSAGDIRGGGAGSTETPCAGELTGLPGQNSREPLGESRDRRAILVSSVRTRRPSAGISLAISGICRVGLSGTFMPIRSPLAGPAEGCPVTLAGAARGHVGEGSVGKM